MSGALYIFTADRVQELDVPLLSFLKAISSGGSVWGTRRQARWIREVLTNRDRDALRHLYQLVRVAGLARAWMVVLGGFFGLSPDVALALALAKRAPDLVLGVPSLMAWQIFETRQLYRRREGASTGGEAARDDPARQLLRKWTRPAGGLVKSSGQAK